MCILPNNFRMTYVSFSDDLQPKYPFLCLSYCFLYYGNDHDVLKMIIPTQQVQNRPSTSVNYHGSIEASSAYPCRTHVFASSLRL